MITSITTIRGRRTAAQDNQTVMAARAAMVSGSGTVLPYGTLLRNRSGRPQRASRVDESKLAFGMIYSGNTVTVYPGTVWLDTVKCKLPAAVTVTCTEQFPCVFVSVPRGGGDATVDKLDETVTYSGDGVGPDDTHVRFTVACFDRTSGSLVLVRRGAGYVVFNPA